MVDGQLTALATADTTLAQSVTTLGSSFSGLVSTVASASTDLSAVATEVAAATSSLATMATQVGGVESDISTLSQTVANLDDGSALASTVSVLSTTVGNNTAAISTASSSLNGIEAKHSIVIDANGVVTGFELLGGGQSGSTVKFTTDNFVISGSGASDKKPFSVSGGNVTIDGDLITSGTITADSIVSNSIAVASTYQVGGAVTQVTAPATLLTSANTNLLGSFTISNPSGIQMKIAVSGAGRSGVQGGSGHFQAFGIFEGTTKLFDYGWSRATEDAKAATFSYTIPAGEARTFTLRGCKSSSDFALSYLMYFTSLGVRN